MTKPLSAAAESLHATMLEREGEFISSETLLTLLGITTSALQPIVQELLNAKLVKVAKTGSSLLFQAVSKSESDKVLRMSGDTAMVYEYIRDSGREGIWTRTLKTKTNLHSQVINNCLKELVADLLIKTIKSVAHPTRKIYMLYLLQPLVAVTGGPWYTDSELDTEFIENLLKVVWGFVVSRTFPKGGEKRFSLTYDDYPLAKTIMDFIVSSKVAHVELALLDVRSLCEVLVYDDALERVGGRPDVYRATWTSVLKQRGVVDEVSQEPFSVLDRHAVMPEPGEVWEPIMLDNWMSQ